ncbi:MAG: hypothetical protein JWQ89_3627 [Devosia sp.]|uniref:hypothetical protein n=1 Tax=Devosia sp. TaxID=1871048 RepID=UPI002618E6F8|nr:hypothetical protein [Devosia sp.]MDB5541900.1 hypothetical protein [Devosia sp.]
MSIVALTRRMQRMDHGRTDWIRDLEQIPDAALHALIIRLVRKTDPALADRLRDASEEERDELHRQIAAGEIP